MTILAIFALDQRSAARRERDKAERSAKYQPAWPDSQGTAGDRKTQQ